MDDARAVLRFADGGWTGRVGGHVALDLVNTVAWRLDPARTVDRLGDGRALLDWAAFAGVLDPDRFDAMSRELARDEPGGRRVAAQARRARDHLYRVLQPIAVGRQPLPADVDHLRRWLLSALGHAEVASVMPLEWTTGLRSMRDLPAELGVRAWSLLEHEDPGRIRQCQDEACGWLFLDRTRNASRVWCSSADCGNRTRARRHYRRHAARTGDPADERERP
jgi:predicted RNA-binding Zn ribbon-like protein